ncbi:MAG: Tm-1-like ATP-binding domain-containing protein, partial [Desulfomonilaceae bacterium]
EEMQIVAKVFAEKLSESKGSTTFLFPMRGWSAIDCPSRDMFAPEEDLIFVNSFKEAVGSKVNVIEVEANLEDESFAEAVVEACLKIFPKTESPFRLS